MKRWLDSNKGMLAGLLLLIVSAYYVNSSMFYHQHVISGETIFHSHIHLNGHHSNSGENDGGHSLAMAKLIALLDKISFEQQLFTSHVEAAEQPTESIAIQRATAQAKFFLERCRSLRAPPALV